MTVSESEGFIKQLMHRRVPQIVGAYIASLWVAVELGGWVTEQLGLPSAYALYLFVLLVSLLPCVVLLAWRHGAPGADEWGRAEKLGIPANVLLAIVLVVMIIQLRPPHEGLPESIRMGAAVVERTVIDETGQEQVFQVARKGFGVSVQTLFWPNADASATGVGWESYAAPWLMGVDLSQDPLISGGAMYNRLVLERLLAAGYEQGIGEPLALGLSIAEDYGADYLIRGNYRREEAGYTLQADLYVVEDGTLLESFSQQGNSLIAASDSLSQRIGERLVGDLDRGGAEFRPLDLAEMTTDNEAVLESFVQGMNALMIDSDFETGVEHLYTATEMDPSFSHAWVMLQQTLRQTGDMAAANAAIEQALQYDYKLETEMRFVLKANQYAILGDIPRAVRVIRMWTEVQPLNLLAWITLTRNLLIVGEVDEARESNVRARELDPDRASLTRTRAEIEELAGNFELASQLLTEYLQAEPDDDAAWISLGGARERSGDIEGAQEAYERASFVASSGFDARERLLRLEGRAGDPERAIRDLQRALAEPLQPSQQARLARELVNVLSNVGRLQELLDVIEQHQEVINQTLPPLARAMTVGGMRISAYMGLGRYQRALEIIEASVEQVPEQFRPIFAVSRFHIHEAEGQVSEAAEQFEIYEEFVLNYDMAGQDILLKAQRARLLAMRDDFVAALAQMEQAESMTRGSVFLLVDEVTHTLTLQKADYQLEAGRLDAAIETVDAFLSIYPNNGQAQLLRARVLHALGQQDEAESQLSKVLELWSSADPEFELLQDANELAAQWELEE